jgi:hypothetical protein
MVYTISRLETSSDGQRFIRLDGENVHVERFFTNEDDEQAIIEECVAELAEKAKDYVAPPTWNRADDTAKAKLVAKVRPDKVTKIRTRLVSEKEAQLVPEATQLEEVTK